MVCRSQRDSWCPPITATIQRIDNNGQPQAALPPHEGRRRSGVLRNSNWRARVFEPAVAKCQKADESFPSITPHDLRHAAASLAISAGANVKAVQRMLGHAKASMTLDVYADLFDVDLDDVAVNLDAAIRAAAEAARKDASQ
jgi:integrase